MLAFNVQFHIKNIYKSCTNIKGSFYLLILFKIRAVIVILRSGLEARIHPAPPISIYSSQTYNIHLKDKDIIMK